jgi:hypothetical protein
MKRLTAAGIGLLVLACGTTRETQTQMQVRMAQEAVAVKTALAPVAQSWQRWFAAGRSDSIAANFTDGGRQMPPNEPAAAGRDAIRARNA